MPLQRPPGYGLNDPQAGETTRSHNALDRETGGAEAKQPAGRSPTVTRMILAVADRGSDIVGIMKSNVTS